MPVIQEEAESRKASKAKLIVSVPKPTQVDGHKCAKAYEINIVKELGKIMSVSLQ